ncbi:MAG: hypothetical protein HY270_15570 [Deltaproteobacteria bacterium]|nr:hypothetical protein [Deltaproteobacteria bacterium]
MGSPLLLPDGFDRVGDDRFELFVRRDMRDWLLPVLRAAPGGWPGQTLERRRSGRGEVVIVRTDHHDCLIRPYRRGGLPAWVLRTLYFGRCPRPFTELVVTESLRRRGAPVVEVYGAAIQWVVPGCYRGWLASRLIAGAQTLWDWARQKREEKERSAVFGRVGRAIRALHDRNGRHPDLNLNNILIHGDRSSPQVCLIDFDRAQLDGMRPTELDLMRLERSARKLDAQRVYVTDSDLAVLRSAYTGAAC